MNYIVQGIIDRESDGSKITRHDMIKHAPSGGNLRWHYETARGQPTGDFKTCIPLTLVVVWWFLRPTKGMVTKGGRRASRFQSGSAAAAAAMVAAMEVALAPPAAPPRPLPESPEEPEEPEPETLLV